MTRPEDKERPEAGADTQHGRKGQGATARDAASGGTRTAAGSTYGDHVPDPARRNDDRDAGPPTARDEAAEEAEKVAEDNRNKDFDTTHTHASTTPRKV